MCSAGHGLKSLYHHKMGFTSLAHGWLPELHVTQHRELCHVSAHLPTGRTYPAELKALQSWVLLLSHQPPSTLHSSGPAACNPSAKCRSPFTWEHANTIGLRTSSCASSSQDVSSQADKKKTKISPKANFESIYITEQGFLSRFPLQNSTVMHCHTTAQLYLQSWFFIMKQIITRQ